jgi:hypothetical protein
MIKNQIIPFIGWIGFSITLLVILLTKSCGDKKNDLHTIEKTIESTRTVVYDSTQRKIIPSKAPISIITKTVVIPAKVDTQAILLAYFAIHTYSDQISDSSLHLQIFDSVSQNKIYGRRIFYQWLKPVESTSSTTITNTPVLKSRSGFYIGGFGDFSKNRYGVGPGLTWLTKKQVMFNYDFDVLNKSHRVGTKFLINARSKN